MKRQRIPSIKTATISATRMGPTLRSSVRCNHPTPACMSYKELIKVVGVDCETGPSSWRKAIDHSAETVVFYQVDLRGTVPRMAKSIRICREEGTGENKTNRLVPSVFVGDMLLSSSYVKTIVGRRFLADEDDLMKLLEYTGVLREDVEITEEGGEVEKENDDWDREAEENAGNDVTWTEPEPKRAKTIATIPARFESSLPQRSTRSSTKHLSTGKDYAQNDENTARDHRFIDLTPMFLPDSPEIPSAHLPSEEAAGNSTALGVPTLFHPEDIEEDLPLDNDSDMGDASNLPDTPETSADNEEELTDDVGCSSQAAIEDPEFRRCIDGLPKQQKPVKIPKTPKTSKAEVNFSFLLKNIPGGASNKDYVPLTKWERIYIPKVTYKELMNGGEYKTPEALYKGLFWNVLMTPHNRRLLWTTRGRKQGFKYTCGEVYADVWDFIQNVARRKMLQERLGNHSVWHMSQFPDIKAIFRREQTSFSSKGKREIRNFDAI